jgi:hypothetical protein
MIPYATPLLFKKTFILSYTVLLSATLLATPWPNDAQLQASKTDIIPPFLFQTIKNKNHVPHKVYANLAIYAPKFKHFLLDDYEGAVFFQTFYDPIYVKTYRLLKGPHKADFLRYGLLYTFGGVYLDIKTTLIQPLHLSIHTKRPLMGAISIVPKTIYQGVLASPRGNPIFLRIMSRMIKTPYAAAKNYILFTQYHYEVLQALSSQPLRAGSVFNHTSSFDLLQERCSRNNMDCPDGLDRYGLCCYLLDKNQKPIFKVRYADYPWGGKV